MNVTNIQQTIEQYKTSILNQINHRTLLQYTGNPFINEEYLFFLLLPFLNGDYWDEEIDEGAITVGIIYASLEEHEKIDEYNATSKVQQLTVLSGDYYSGRYYEILGQSGNIPLIREMSKAILIRCEYQMKIYEPNTYKVDEWIETLQLLESGIIESFYNVYGFKNYVQVMKYTLLIRRMKKELQNLLEDKGSVFIEKMIESNDKELNALSLEKVIENEIEMLTNRLREVVHSSNLRDELKQYILNQVASV